MLQSNVNNQKRAINFRMYGLFYFEEDFVDKDHHLTNLSSLKKEVKMMKPK